MSRIGKRPISIPANVKVNIAEQVVTVEGPKGKLSYAFSPRITLVIENNTLVVKRNSHTKLDRSLHGLTRALLANMVKGVTEGYVKELEIVGVGYKAQMQGNVLNMSLGFSHPVNFVTPEGIKIETPKPTQIVVSGIDKQKVGKVAAEIRAICPPEPYKGKGIRYLGERVKKKIGKAQAAAGK